MAYKLLLLGKGQATEPSNAQTMHKKVNVNSLENVKVKILTANAALTEHILSETTTDESTLTYADNGIQRS